MSSVAVLIKHTNIAEKTKGTYGAYQRLPKGNTKEKFIRAHEGEIILHQSATRAFGAAGYTAPKDISVLENTYSHLAKKKNKLRGEYIWQKNKLKKAEMIKRNVDSMLAPTHGREIVLER